MTRVIEHPADWAAVRRAQRREGKTLGFVPTMGALHDGHRALIERARCENDRTLVSIFVNPTQFDDPSDFDGYPRSLEADLAILRRMGVDAVLAPQPSALYPDHYQYRVTELELSRRLEGAHRPGHFDGVLTVVLKLLLIASADRAYFGEKDWQQLELVRGLVQAFFVPTSIVACATVREVDGLALSSRNRRLSPTQRVTAPLLYHALTACSTAEAAARTLTEAGFVVDYVQDQHGRRLGAARLGDVRLIDNVPTGDSR